jgi:hypothetical protein
LVAHEGTGAEPKLPEASIAREPAAFTPPKVAVILQYQTLLLTLLLIHFSRHLY